VSLYPLLHLHDRPYINAQFPRHCAEPIAAYCRSKTLFECCARCLHFAFPHIANEHQSPTTKPPLSSTCEKAQKTAPLGAVFGVLSTTPQHVGIAALGPYAKL